MASIVSKNSDFVKPWARRVAIRGKKTDLVTAFKSWSTNVGDQQRQPLCGNKRGSEEAIDVGIKKKKKSQLRMGPDMALKCFVALKKLMSHPYGAHFNYPVDLPGYIVVIRKPMDLGTIERKFERDFYATAEEFESDVILTFSNAMRFHPLGSPLYNMAKELHSLFNARNPTKSLSNASHVNASQYPATSLSNASHVNAKIKEASMVNLNLKACNLKVSPGHDKVDQKLKTASQDGKLRQRQREREAARIARDNMESSVAFEDNISILTELAYLTGDFSFAGPLGGSGSMYVKRELWRPLERFGLYLKDE